MSYPLKFRQKVLEVKDKEKLTLEKRKLDEFSK